MRIRLCIVALALSASVLLLPWLAVGLVTLLGLGSDELFIAILSSGGPKGRLIDAVLYALPTIGTGAVLAIVLGHKRLMPLVIVMSAVAVLAFLNLIGLFAATRRWPLELLSHHPVITFSRLIQSFAFVGMGVLLGSAVESARRQNKVSES